MGTTEIVFLVLLLLVLALCFLSGLKAGGTMKAGILNLAILFVLLSFSSLLAIVGLASPHAALLPYTGIAGLLAAFFVGAFTRLAWRSVKRIHEKRVRG